MRLLELLFGDAAAAGPDPGGDLDAWLELLSDIERRWPRPFDRAVAAGHAADRLGFAFAGGYQAALAALLPDLEGRASLCVTEAGGNRPQAIETTLEARRGGGFRLAGTKEWATLAPRAEVLVVAARAGTSGDRPVIRLVRVPASAAGVDMEVRPATPFAPEIPHAKVTFSGVELDEAALVPGDGYQLVKAFRTVEDLHVHGAATGYLAGVARRWGWAPAIAESLAAHAVTLGALAGEEPLSPATHRALGGALAAGEALLREIEPSWETVPEDERERWRRDRGLFAVAASARRARLARARESS